MNNDINIPVSSLTALLSLVFVLVSAVINIIIFFVIWTWKVGEFRSSLRIKEVETNARFTQLEKDSVLLRRDVESSVKELSKRTGNLEAQVQHIENHLAKTDTGFRPVGVRRRDDTYQY